MAHWTIMSSVNSGEFALLRNYCFAGLAAAVLIGSFQPCLAGQTPAFKWPKKDDAEAQPAASDKSDSKTDAKAEGDATGKTDEKTGSAAEAEAKAPEPERKGAYAEDAVKHYNRGV